MSIRFGRTRRCPSKLDLWLASTAATRLLAREGTRDQPLGPVQEPVHVRQIGARGAHDPPQSSPRFLIRFAKVDRHPCRGSAHAHRIAPSVTVDDVARLLAKQEQTMNTS